MAPNLPYCPLGARQACSVVRAASAGAPSPHCPRVDIALQCTPFIPEARAVLALVDQCPEPVKKGTFPVIAIEGLDATGQRTLPCCGSNQIAGAVAGVVP